MIGQQLPSGVLYHTSGCQHAKTTPWECPKSLITPSRYSPRLLAKALQSIFDLRSPLSECSLTIWAMKGPQFSRVRNIFSSSSAPCSSTLGIRLSKENSSLLDSADSHCPCRSARIFRSQLSPSERVSIQGEFLPERAVKLRDLPIRLGKASIPSIRHTLPPAGT